MKIHNFNWSSDKENILKSCSGFEFQECALYSYEEISLKMVVLFAENDRYNLQLYIIINI